MINNIIRNNENMYLVRRILNSNTTEEQATRIHHNIGTDALLRDKEGKWFCCMQIKDAQYKDVELIPTQEEQDYSHTQFELGDNGGMG